MAIIMSLGNGKNLEVILNAAKERHAEFAFNSSGVNDEILYLIEQGFDKWHFMSINLAAPR
jgi:hypothetical protein